MKAIGDMLAGLVIACVAIYLVYTLIRPYAWLIVVVLLAAFVGERVYVRMRRW